MVCDACQSKSTLSSSDRNGRWFDGANPTIGMKYSRNYAGHLKPCGGEDRVVTLASPNYPSPHKTNPKHWIFREISTTFYHHSLPVESWLTMFGPAQSGFQILESKNRNILSAPSFATHVTLEDHWVLPLHWKLPDWMEDSKHSQVAFYSIPGYYLMYPRFSSSCMTGCQETHIGVKGGPSPSNSPLRLPFFGWF